MVKVTDSVADVNPGSQGEPTLSPSSCCFLPSKVLHTGTCRGLYSAGEGTSHNSACGGQGWVERGEGGGKEDFPKEASPGQMGEEGRDLGQERLGFK